MGGRYNNGAEWIVACCSPCGKCMPTCVPLKCHLFLDKQMLVAVTLHVSIDFPSARQISGTVGGSDHRLVYSVSLPGR